MTDGSETTGIKGVDTERTQAQQRYPITLDYLLHRLPPQVLSDAVDMLVTEALKTDLLDEQIMLRIRSLNIAEIKSVADRLKAIREGVRELARSTRRPERSAQEEAPDPRSSHPGWCSDEKRIIPPDEMADALEAAADEMERDHSPNNRVSAAGRAVLRRRAYLLRKGGYEALKDPKEREAAKRAVGIR